VDGANQRVAMNSAPFNYLVTPILGPPTNQRALFFQTGHAPSAGGGMMGIRFKNSWLPIYCTIKVTIYLFNESEK